MQVLADGGVAAAAERLAWAELEERAGRGGHFADCVVVVCWVFIVVWRGGAFPEVKVAWYGGLGIGNTHTNGMQEYKYHSANRQQSSGGPFVFPFQPTNRARITKTYCLQRTTPTTMNPCKNEKHPRVQVSSCRSYAITGNGD